MQAQAQIRQFQRLLYRKAFSVIKYVDSLEIAEGHWLNDHQTERMCAVCPSVPISCLTLVRI
jgi:hypothetical protein